jgi:hypothetical protein
MPTEFKKVFSFRVLHASYSENDSLFRFGAPGTTLTPTTQALVFHILCSYIYSTAAELSNSQRLYDMQILIKLLCGNLQNFFSFVFRGILV